MKLDIIADRTICMGAINIAAGKSLVANNADINPDRRVGITHGSSAKVGTGNIVDDTSGDTSPLFPGGYLGLGDAGNFELTDVTVSSGISLTAQSAVPKIQAGGQIIIDGSGFRCRCRRCSSAILSGVGASTQLDVWSPEAAFASRGNCRRCVDPAYGES